MKNILIVPSNTDLNRGDQALTWASISIVKDLYQKENININLYRIRGKLADKTQTNHQTINLGFPLLTRILSHPRRDDTEEEVMVTKFKFIKWGFRALIDLATTLPLLSKLKILNYFAYLFLDKDRRYTYNKFKKLDVIFMKGGGFLHSYGSWADPYVMYFQLFDVFLAKRFGIPVVILPNSIGPLNNCLAKKIVFKALNYAKIIYVREDKSHKFLHCNGINSIKSPDLGFYLKPSKSDFQPYLNKLKIPLFEKKCVGITLRPYRFDGASNSQKLYDNYITQIKILIGKLLDKQISIVLVAHTIGPSAHENDSIALLEVYEMFRSNPNVIYLDDKRLNSKDLVNIYSYFDLMIGTRFHSVIFSVNVNTPAIAIAYGGNKATGIMNDMNLSQFTIPIEDPNGEKLFELASIILEDPSGYLDRLAIYKSKLKIEYNKLISQLLNLVK